LIKKPENEQRQAKKLCQKMVIQDIMDMVKTRKTEQGPGTGIRTGRRRNAQGKEFGGEEGT
jgi:hypothetical protein